MKINHSYVKWDKKSYIDLLVKYYETYQKSLGFSDQPLIRPAYYLTYGRLWFKDINHVFNKKINFNLINDQYFEGHFVLKILNCSFSEFHNYMVYGIPDKFLDYIYPRRSKYKWRHWLRAEILSNRFRQKLKFQNKGYAKKEKSEHQLSKENWKKQKGLDKDKRKCGYRRRRSCPNYSKRKFNKQHRQWQRDNINHENWEELMNYKKLKWISDPWHYD